MGTKIQRVLSLDTVFDRLIWYSRVGIPKLCLAEAWILESSRIKVGLEQSSADQLFPVAS